MGGRSYVHRGTSVTLRLESLTFAHVSSLPLGTSVRLRLGFGTMPIKPMGMIAQQQTSGGISADTYTETLKSKCRLDCSSTMGQSQPDMAPTHNH